MWTVKELVNEIGYSKDQIITACHRCNIQMVGHQFVIQNKTEKNSIIEEIKSRRPGNPNFKKSKKN